MVIHQRPVSRMTNNGSEQNKVPKGTHKLNKCCLWSLLLLLDGDAQLAMKRTSRVVVVVVVEVVVVVVVQERE